MARGLGVHQAVKAGPLRRTPTANIRANRRARPEFPGCARKLDPPGHAGDVAHVSEARQPPQLKANMVQLALRHVDALGPEVAQPVRARLQPQTAARIESAARVEWLPAQLQVELNDALASVVDEAAYHAFWLEVGKASAQGSIFATVAQGAMRLFGASPVSIYKMMPRANALVTRGTGDHRVETFGRDRRLRVTTANIPPELLQTDTWVRSSRATMAVPLWVVDATGTVEVDDSEIADGTVHYDVAWE